MTTQWKLMLTNAICSLVQIILSKQKTEKFCVTNSKIEKLVGIKFDHKLSFDNDISELCKKASRNIHPLS